MSSKDSGEIFKRAMIECADRRGKSVAEKATMSTPSTSTLRLYKKEYGIGERVPQPNFKARQESLKDPRMAGVWAAMMAAVFGCLPSFKKFNGDQSMTAVEQLEKEGRSCIALKRKQPLARKANVSLFLRTTTVVVIVFS